MSGKETTELTMTPFCELCRQFKWLYIDNMIQRFIKISPHLYDMAIRDKMNDISRYNDFIKQTYNQTNENRFGKISMNTDL